LPVSPAPAGSSDGVGSKARLSFPAGLAVDPAGNVYVADYGGLTVRKIAPDGTVTTLAGTGSQGSTDGLRSGASFDRPKGMAIDSAGNLYTADEANFTIRKITPAGVVSTIAGSVGSAGSTEPIGSAAHFFYPQGVACDAADNLYVVESNNYLVRKITPAGEVTTLAGAPGLSGSADGTGDEVGFNTPEGIAVDANGAVYVADAFNHTIRTSAALSACSVAPLGLINWWPADVDATDIRGRHHGTLQNGAVLSAGEVDQGFTLNGGSYVDIPDAPNLNLTTNVPPSDELEATAVATLTPGNYTAVLGDKNGGSGVGLVELYDLGTAGLDASSSSKLVEISTRGKVGTGDNNVMIGGFIISGASTKVIARAIGPELTTAGVAGALQDTTLELRDGAGALVVGNDDWRTNQEQQIIDTAVPPTDDRESAVVATLPPGNYTAVVRGKNETIGVALVEVYSLQ
jgi:hypothetical protein